MQNAVINSLYNENSAYKYRPQTDVLFKLPQGSFSYKGIIDKEIRHVEKYLLDAELWAVFVNQFRSASDEEYDGRWRGEYWGKAMRGACFTYEYTKNKTLYDVLTHSVKDMLTTQDKNGRFSTYSREHEFTGWDVWGRKYVLLGFQYFLDICKDNALKDTIIKAMCVHADYIISKVGKEDGKISITSTSNRFGGVNSSSVLEPMVRLYNITGKQKYLDFATYIIENGGSSEGNIFRLAYEGKVLPCEYPVTKAYETMSCFEGLLEYYRATKEEWCLTASVNFGKLLLDTEITIIGCAGCNHEEMNFSAKSQTSTTYPGTMLEACVTVTWMKYCFQLLLLTGDSAFANALEKSVYNAMLGAVNSYDSKMLTAFPFDSFSPMFMSLRARVVSGTLTMENGKFAYGCCACIGSAGTALMALSSAALSNDGVYMNLYVPGSIKALTPCGNSFTLDVDTLYPAQSQISISINGVCGGECFKIAFRKPNWCSNFTLSLNGKPQSTKLENGYIILEKAWEDGDKILLDFEMPMLVIKPPYGGADENSRYLVALQKGPVVFARDKRLGQEIDGVVDIMCDKNSVVNAIKSSTCPFPCEQEYKIPLRDGSYFTVVDYQSAGKTWDEGSAMTAWFPTKNFWSFDIKKPITLEVRHSRGHLALSKTSDLSHIVKPTDSSQKIMWTTEECADGKVRFKDSNNMYLTAHDEQNGKIKLILSESKDCDSQSWIMSHFAVNQYRIISAKYTNMCITSNDRGNDFILCDIYANQNYEGKSTTNNAFVDIFN